jgi:hypothetical protein
VGGKCPKTGRLKFSYTELGTNRVNYKKRFQNDPLVGSDADVSVVRKVHSIRVLTLS